jgi:hypothetical protein
MIFQKIHIMFFIKGRPGKAHVYKRYATKGNSLPPTHYVASK